MTSMRKLLALVLYTFLLNYCAHSWAQQTELQLHPKSFHYEKDVSGHRVVVELKKGPFDPDKHKCVILDKQAYIDDLLPIGTDNTLHAEEEFTQFQVFFDGVLVPIPHEAFSCIYNVALQPAKWWDDRDGGSILVIPSKSQQSILVKMQTGGDGVTEWVWLAIDRSGEWRRYTGASSEDAVSSSVEK